MKRRCLAIVGALALVAMLCGAWVLDSRLTSRLQAVEVERPGGVRFRADDPDFLRNVELWYHAIEPPALRQRLSRITGRWTEPGLRQPDYEVVLVFRDGRREALAVWVYAKDYVPVSTARWSGTAGGRGDTCLARSEPFTAFVATMHRNGR